MSLSCEYDYDPEPGDVCWEWSGDLKPLATKRWRKCASCHKRIDPGEKALRFRRWKIPEHDIEIAIYGEDGDCGPPRAPWYHCADCGLIALFLASPPLYYVFQIHDDMRKLSKEHAAMVALNRAGCV